MNNIDEMPAKCKSCPYWEACEYPYICQGTEPKPAENGDINAKIAENLQNRPTNGNLISRQAALDAIHCDITVTGRQNAELVAATIGAFADRIKALPPVQPKHGEWEYHSNPTIGINPEDAYCSCCGFHVDTTGNIDFDEYNFCPRCGADMRCSENPNS